MFSVLPLPNLLLLILKNGRKFLKVVNIILLFFLKVAITLIFSTINKCSQKFTSGKKS